MHPTEDYALRKLVLEANGRVLRWSDHVGPTLAALPQLRALTLVHVGLLSPKELGAIIKAAPRLRTLILLAGTGTEPRAWAEPDVVRFALSLSLSLSLSLYRLVDIS